MDLSHSLGNCIPVFVKIPLLRSMDSASCVEMADGRSSPALGEVDTYVSQTAMGGWLGMVLT